MQSVRLDLGAPPMLAPRHPVQKVGEGLAVHCGLPRQRIHRGVQRSTTLGMPEQALVFIHSGYKNKAEELA